MALYRFVLLLALIAAAKPDDSCPSAEDLNPCTCDGEGLNCMGDTTLEQIKKAFKSNFKYGGVRSVWIQGTKIEEVPKDMFSNVKAQSFYVEVNEITKVDMDAFSASKRSLHTLSMFGNKLRSFPFKDLEPFERLGTLNLGRNKIESIPAGSFNSRSLFVVILAQNEIKQIGLNAFANVPSLGRLELSMNKLTELGPMSLAMKSHNEGLQINLSGNIISDVSSSAFTGTAPYGIFFSSNQLKSLKNDPFANLITRIAQKGGFMEVSANPFTCQGCDDYSWLVDNKDILGPKLVGFLCTDGRQLSKLTKLNVGCSRRRHVFV